MNSIYLSTDRARNQTVDLLSKFQKMLIDFGFKKSRKKPPEGGGNYSVRNIYILNEIELILSQREEDTNNNVIRHVIILECENHSVLLHYAECLQECIAEYDRGYLSPEAERQYHKTLQDMSKPTGQRYNFIEDKIETNLYVVTKGKVPKVFNNGQEIECEVISLVHKKDEGWFYQIKYDGVWYDVNLTDDDAEIWV